MRFNCLKVFLFCLTLSSHLYFQFKAHVSRYYPLLCKITESNVIPERQAVLRKLYLHIGLVIDIAQLPEPEPEPQPPHVEQESDTGGVGGWGGGPVMLHHKQPVTQSSTEASISYLCDCVATLCHLRTLHMVYDKHLTGVNQLSATTHSQLVTTHTEYLYKLQRYCHWIKLLINN